MATTDTDADAAATTDAELVAISERYFAAWERRDPDAIAALHTEDSQFWLHDGGEPVVGRAAVRATFAELFVNLPEFGFESYRVLYGPGFWVLDWAVLAELDGRPIRFDAVDVVNVSADGLVARKDTFVDHAQMVAALGGEA